MSTLINSTTMKNMKNILLSFFSISMLTLGIVMYSTADTYAADTWCPPCSSDFCQSGAGDYLLIIGGTCYCCVELSTQQLQ